MEGISENRACGPLLKCRHFLALADAGKDAFVSEGEVFSGFRLRFGGCGSGRFFPGTEDELAEGDHKLIEEFCEQTDKERGGDGAFAHSGEPMQENEGEGDGDGSEVIAMSKRTTSSVSSFSDGSEVIIFSKRAT